MTKPIFSTEEHRATGWSLFVAREQIKRPVGYAVRAIRPAKLKRQVKKQLYQLQFSLGQLREYLEAEVAAREIDPCTAYDLYYRPNHVKPAREVPALIVCSDSRLAQAFNAELRIKIFPDGKNNGPYFTNTDIQAIEDFLDTAIYRNIELPLEKIIAEMTDRKRRSKIEKLCKQVTAARRNLRDLLQPVTESASPVDIKATTKSPLSFCREVVTR